MAGGLSDEIHRQLQRQPDFDFDYLSCVWFNFRFGDGVDGMMDLQKEREAFEDWYCKNHTALKQSDLAKFRTLSGYSFSDPLKVNISWEAWQAARAQAVPNGFVLVPTEPTERMLDSAYSSISDNLHYADLENIYKAMIAAAQEKKE